MSCGERGAEFIVWGVLGRALGDGFNFSPLRPLERLERQDDV
jgi:hypothetical protein